MSGLSAAEQAEINVTLGAIVVSNNLSYLTMGIVLCATWIYFSKFPNDTWWFKAPVIVCVSICIADTIATGMWSYDWAVANYGNPAALAFTYWALPAEPSFYGTCGLIVQLFYAWRIWTMSLRKNWILPIVIGCLSILGWCILCWVVHTIATHSLLSQLDLLLPVLYIWLGGSAAADVIITGSMIYYLDLRFRFERHKAGTVYQAPRRFRQIIVRTVEINLLSLLAQAAAIGLFNHSSIGFYYAIPDMMLAKVYTFSLLVSLNTRQSQQSYGTSGGFSSSFRVGGNRDALASSTLPTAIFPSTQITADTEREATCDWEKQTTGPVTSAKELHNHVLSWQV
ncbi:hypothetical protein BT96DRAFT_925313 [Gymnopus androsaceus JB14]|uniref:DUF6534 domain-containing protein n=1 Tax=Gymnopus androsaceus JB14 TaxID=1447944 RepID=A0A6A4H0X9_9AGAR|nr:hypothetical protein BT96DRAFT_925313 [Gymnopus androsaceus JB14]